MGLEEDGLHHADRTSVFQLYSPLIMLGPCAACTRSPATFFFLAPKANCYALQNRTRVRALPAGS